MEQIDSYAPGHQVRFGSLNYTADIRGDLIFDGFEPQPGAPHCRDGYITPSMRLYLPRVEARLRGIIALKAYVASEVIFTQPM